MIFLPILGILVSGSQHLLEFFYCTHFLLLLPQLITKNRGYVGNSVTKHRQASTYQLNSFQRHR
jgi:hypothetical protein